MKSKRKFGPDFKAKVAIEAIKEHNTLAQIAEKYELHPNQVSAWKKEFLEKSSLVFSEKLPEKRHDEEIKHLLEEIGRLGIENKFLKKKLY